MTIPKDDFDTLNRTSEVLSEKDLMAQLKASNRDDVKSRDFEEVAKELGI